MTELEKFYDLKEKVLLKYQEHYPYFQRNWKSFSSQDIQNLITIIEEKTKQTISEKWIYTHLKPASNEKLPRKDTLTILSQFVGFSGWDEFNFDDKVEPESKDNHDYEKINFKKYRGSIFILLILIFAFLLTVFKDKKTTTIELKNEFTNEKVSSKEVKAYQIENEIKTPIEIKDSKLDLKNVSRKTKIIIESPYFKKKIIKISEVKNQDIVLQPDDFGMMLKGFMKADIKDWQTRKEQLDKILSDDLEVIVMLKNDLGFESFNKEEFAQKLILPTQNIKKMQIIAIEKDDSQKIKFVRIKQE